MFKKFVVFMLMLVFTTPVHANSAQTWFTGSDASGVVMTGESSPLVVESEKLVFEINDLPQNYSSIDDFLTYDSSVSAEYQIYNPSSLTIEARLLFPFGTNPSYVYIYDEAEQKCFQNVDTDKYKVMVDHKEIQKILRHTFKLEYEDFSLKKDLNLLVDGCKNDDFYKRDLNVIKLTYHIDGIDTQTFSSAYASMEFMNHSKNTRIYMKQLNGYSLSGDNVQMGLFVNDSQDVEVYIIGDSLENDFKWYVYEDAQKEKQIAGNVTLVSSETMTFEDLAMSEYHAESHVLATDWYNAIIDMLNYYNNQSIIIHVEKSLDISDELMRWYDYTIEVEPETTIINTVVAPLYPSIDTSYDSPIYEYTYLLSPAKKWKTFNNLDIKIYTDCYLQENSIGSFSQVDNGYFCTLDNLPQSELQFKLCKDKNPTKTSHSHFITQQLPFIIVVGCLVIGVIVIVKKGKKQ